MVIEWSSFCLQPKSKVYDYFFLNALRSYLVSALVKKKIKKHLQTLDYRLLISYFKK